MQRKEKIGEEGVKGKRRQTEEAGRSGDCAHTQVCTLKYFANAQLVSSHGSTQVDQ